MTSVALIGIDVGTSGCKASLVDSEGKLLAEASAAYASTYPKEGWAEQDPDDWYQAVVSSVRALISRPEARDAEVAGIGVTGQMISAVFIDKNGVPVYPAILWMDQRSFQEANLLEEQFGEEISAITKTPINTAYTLPRILWLRKHVPEAWEHVYKVMLPKDYIRLRLSGVYATDPSDASGTLLLDSERKSWSTDILRLTEVPEGILPTLIPSHEPAGQLTAKAAKELGLPSGISIVTGAGDLFAENLAAGNLDPAHRLIRFGSCGSVSLPLTRPVLDPKKHCPCYVHCVPDHWLLETSAQAFGLAEAWFKKQFLDAVELSVHELADRLAASVPPGSDGLIFHPFIQGAPYWNPSLKGAFCGITPNHTKAHFIRSVLEGTTYSLLDAIQLLDEAIGGKVDSEGLEWRAIGGGTESAVWPQIVADAIGSDLTILKDVSSAKGAALLAGIGMGIFLEVDKTINAIQHVSRKVHADRMAHVEYQRSYQRYQWIHKKIS